MPWFLARPYDHQTSNIYLFDSKVQYHYHIEAETKWPPFFADDTFKRIFLNENVSISIKISLKFVPKGPINNIPALVQIMAWRRSGDKPLSEPMLVSSLMHICVTRPQWVIAQQIFVWYGVSFKSMKSELGFQWLKSLQCCIWDEDAGSQVVCSIILDYVTKEPGNQGCCAKYILDIRPKLILNRTLAKSRSPISSVSIV